MRQTRILEAAAAEAQAAADWYEQERTGLGVDFAEAVEAAVSLIEEDILPLAPMPGASGAECAKRLILRKSPYDIVIRETFEETIVVAIAHHAREPGYWKGRIGDESCVKANSTR